MTNPSRLPPSQVVFPAPTPTALSSSSLPVIPQQPSPSPRRRYPLYFDAIAGAFAGASSRLITAPLDLVKIRLQLQTNFKSTHVSPTPMFPALLTKSPTMLSTFTSVIKDEGVTGLFKGNLAATYLWITYAAIQFSMYAHVSEYLSSDETRHSSDRFFGSHLSPSSVAFIAGASAGLTATVLTYPFDYCRTSFAADKNLQSSLAGFVAATFKTNGVGGFYAGLVPAMVSIVPLMGLNFLLYETMMKSLSKADLATSSGLAGAISGGLSKFAVYPLDTIKKRMQGQAFSQIKNSVVYRNTIDCGVQIFRDEGFKTFYRGIAPTMIKSTVSTGFTFAAFNLTKSWLEKNHDYMATE